MRHVSLEDPGDLEQVAHLFRRLRPLAEPLPRLLLVHLDVRRLLLRVVSTDPVDKPTVARAARIGHHYPVEGIALGAVPRQPYLYRHTISSRTVTLPAARQAGNARHPAALAHLAHHLLHLVELFDELLDVLLGRARAPRNPTRPARVLQQLRVSALLHGHRGDHGLHPAELPVVYLDILELLVEAGDHAKKPGERAHLLDHLHLLQEVLEGELAAHELLALRLGLGLVHLLLGLLDEREHVTHPQDASSHPVGVEVVELAHLLALGGELDRPPRHRDDRKRGTTARVTVELGEDHTVEIGVLLKCLRHLDRVLAGDHVQDQKDRMRLRHLPDATYLLHHLHVHHLATGRVHYDEVVPAVPGLLDATFGDVLGAGTRSFRVDRHRELAPDLLQLLYGGGPVSVARDEVRVLPELAHEQRQFAGGRGLAVAVEAREHDDRGRPGGEREFVGGAAHQVGELLVHYLDDLLAWTQRLGDLGAGGPLADVGDELLDHAVVHVGFQQGQPDLARHLLYLVFRKVAAAADTVEGLVEPLA